MRMFKKTLLALLCLSFTTIVASGCFGEGEDTTPLESSPEVSTSNESDESDDSNEDSDSSDTTEKYVISFINAETGEAVADSIEFTEETMEDIVFPAIPESAKKAGYTAAWNKTVEDVTLANLEVSLVYTVIEYTVQFVDTEGNAIVGVEPITFTVETSALLLGFPQVPESYQKEGYTVAWDKTPLDITLSNMEVTLAYTAIEYTVQFVDLEGADIVGVNPITYTAETIGNIVFPAVPDSYQTVGYTVAWDKTPANVTLGGCTVTLAQPVANTYQITYDVNGGSEVEGQAVTFGAPYTVATAPTREYYEFQGWYVVENGEMTETKVDSGEAWAIADDVTLKAKWAFVEGEYAMKYKFNVTDDPITQITKQAYPGGSEVSFKYYIPEGTTTGWWGIAWHTDATQANNYHAAGIENAIGYKGLVATTGSWVDVNFTLPTGGEYYLYFGAEVDPSKWVVNGGKSYALIDDFKIGEVTEDFNGGVDDSIFAVNVENAVTLGEGYVAPVFEEGEYAMKYNFNVTDNPITQITKQAYAGGSEVSFKYYIPEGTTTGWWGIAWNPNAEHANNYHAAGIEANYVGHQSLGTTTGSWVDVKFTLPAGGEYYLYFGAEVNPDNKWVLNGGNSYALIDDFKIGEVTEDFNKPFEENGMFNVLVPGAVMLSEKGEGAPEAIKGNTMLTFEATAIGGGERVAMITGAAYAGVSEITFDAVWTGNATSARWGLSYTTDPTKFSYGTEVSALNCYTPKLGGLNMDVGVQYTYKLTFADGKYYLSAKAVGASEFTDISNGDYTEGANYFYIMVCPAVGGEGSIFYMDNFSITTTSGTVIDTFDDEASTLFIESATNTSHYGSSGMGFITSTFGEEAEA